jgi:hypothetical protein
MKSNVENMQDEMTRLSTNIQQIDNLNDKITGNLADRRKKIEKLSGIHSLLTKVSLHAIL